MLAAGVAIPMPGARDAQAAAGLDPLAPAREASGRAGEIVPAGNPLWAVPLEALSATRERPIFSISRRPPAPPPVFVAAEPSAPPPRAPPAPPERPALVLLGTINGGSLHLGIFHDETAAKTLRLAVGESFDGWVLRAVSAADAQFETDGRIATLPLRPVTQLAMKSEPAGDGEMPMMPVRRKRR